MSFRCKTMLAAAVASACAGLANAQTLEETLVTASPIRDSQMAAIEYKRNADNVLDVVSADTIGRFPDQNLADSLGRVPGVAIERDQGQARYINLRGAPFRYTSIAFDGIDVPGAENGRIPRFDAFPSVITSRLEVNKAVLPSMPAEAVAGHINIRTFSPFDRQGASFVADIGAGEQELGGGDVEKANLRGSWSGDHFGIVAYSSKNSREQITDNREYDLERADDGSLITNELDMRSYRVKREDEAYGGQIEYRGDNMLERAFVSTLYSEFTDYEERNQYVFGPMAPVEGNVAQNVPTLVNRLLEDGEYHNSTDTTTFGADLAVGEWNVDLRYNITKTEFEMDLPIPYSIAAFTLADYDMSSLENPQVTLAQPLNTLDYAVTLGLHYVQEMNVDADKFKVDVSRDIAFMGNDSTLAFGAQYDQREADGFVATPAIGGFPAVDIYDYDTGKAWESNTTNSIGGTYYDNKGLRQAWADSGLLTNPSIADTNLVAIEEDVFAAYAMMTSRFTWGDVVYGLRVEETDYTSAGTVDGTPISVGDTFVNVMPSVHVNVDLAEDLKLRVSGSSGLNRPTYNEWRAAASVNVTDKTIDGGNPNLDAEEAWGFDASLEWYFSDASMFSVGAYYRDVSDVIYADSTMVDAGQYFAPSAGEMWEYTGTVNGGDGSLEGLEFNLIAQAGDFVEVLDGFGFSGNVTFVDSEFDGLDGQSYKLPGTSDLIYNASLFFEKFGLSARINYQYRDEWISPIEDPSEYWGEQERVDLSVQYDLPFDMAGIGMTVYANINNLTDETDKRYAGNGTINQSESYGEYWLMGFRVSY